MPDDVLGEQLGQGLHVVCSEGHTCAHEDRGMWLLPHDTPPLTFGRWGGQLAGDASFAAARRAGLESGRVGVLAELEQPQPCRL
jgi:hypothetical protein